MSVTRYIDGVRHCACSSCLVLTREELLRPSEDAPDWWRVCEECERSLEREAKEEYLSSGQRGQLHDEEEWS